MTKASIKIGTRASPLALAQAHAAKQAIAALDVFADYRVELVEFSTKGDRILNQPLAEIGGKGLFTQELTAALRDGSIDLAVHSLKDLPTADEDGLVIAAVPARATVVDTLVFNPELGLSFTPDDPIAALPQGAIVGTASLRRRAQLLRRRPDLDVVTLRGNVGTRLAKMKEQGLAAIVLAGAGLARLGLELDTMVPVPTVAMVPAAGQGALAFQCVADNDAIRTGLASLHDAETAVCVAAERAFLAALDGNCRTPIAATARVIGTGVELHGRILALDGQDMAERIATALKASAAELGQELAQQIKQEAPHLVMQGG